MIRPSLALSDLYNVVINDNGAIAPPSTRKEPFFLAPVDSLTKCFAFKHSNASTHILTVKLHANNVDASLLCDDVNIFPHVYDIQTLSSEIRYMFALNMKEVATYLDALAAEYDVTMPATSLIVDKKHNMLDKLYANAVAASDTKVKKNSIAMICELLESKLIGSETWKNFVDSLYAMSNLGYESTASITEAVQKLSKTTYLIDILFKLKSFIALATPKPINLESINESVVDNLTKDGTFIPGQLITALSLYASKNDFKTHSGTYSAAYTNYAESIQRDVADVTNELLNACNVVVNEGLSDEELEAALEKAKLIVESKYGSGMFNGFAASLVEQYNISAIEEDEQGNDLPEDMVTESVQDADVDEVKSLIAGTEYAKYHYGFSEKSKSNIIVGNRMVADKLSMLLNDNGFNATPLSFRGSYIVKFSRNLNDVEDVRFIKFDYTDTSWTARISKKTDGYNIDVVKGTPAANFKSIDIPMSKTMDEAIATLQAMYKGGEVIDKKQAYVNESVMINEAVDIDLDLTQYGVKKEKYAELEKLLDKLHIKYTHVDDNTLKFASYKDAMVAAKTIATQINESVMVNEALDIDIDLTQYGVKKDKYEALQKLLNKEHIKFIHTDDVIKFTSYKDAMLAAKLIATQINESVNESVEHTFNKEFFDIIQSITPVTVSKHVITDDGNVIIRIPYGSTAKSQNVNMLTNELTRKLSKTKFAKDFVQSFDGRGMISFVFKQNFILESTDEVNESAKSGAYKNFTTSEGGLLTVEYATGIIVAGVNKPDGWVWSYRKGGGGHALSATSGGVISKSMKLAALHAQSSLGVSIQGGIDNINESSDEYTDEEIAKANQGAYITADEFKNPELLASIAESEDVNESLDRKTQAKIAIELKKAGFDLGEDFTMSLSEFIANDRTTAEGMADALSDKFAVNMKEYGTDGKMSLHIV